MTETIKEPTELQKTLDKRERVIDDAAESVYDTLRDHLKAVLDEIYEEGFEAGELVGEDDARTDYERDNPLIALIDEVKLAQQRDPYFEPPPGRLNVRFYDLLIQFLEEERLPLEWRP